MASLESTASLGLDGITQERLQRFAAARQRSSDSIMREAVEQYLAREEKGEQLWHDTVEAWDEYRQTGVHVTGAEMERWFDKIEAGEGWPPPLLNVISDMVFTQPAGPQTPLRLSGSKQPVRRAESHDGDPIRYEASRITAGSRPRH